MHHWLKKLSSFIMRRSKVLKDFDDHSTGYFALIIRIHPI